MALGGARTSSRLNSLRFVSHWWAGSVTQPERKLNRLVLVTYPTYPPSFVTTRPQPFDILCCISFMPLSLNGEESLRKKREGHSVERIPPPRNAWSTRMYRAPIHFWNIMAYRTISFLALCLNGEESLKKLNNSHIQIQIFTTIE